MDSTRIINIGLLEGKSNWSTWKYKAAICLRGISGALDVVNGKLIKPEPIGDDVTAEQRAVYKRELESFLKADSNALIVLTTNMTEETLKKVMRLTTAREVWDELHKLFDGVSEDKVYDLCLQFFGFKMNSGDDIATHMSKLKNLWTDLKQEMSKDPQNNTELPELFLICKILGTLPEEYFSFKSSWMLMSRNDRTLDNLTNQLCAYEKALTSKGADSLHQGALVVTDSSKQKSNFSKGVKYKKTIICNYCKKPGHIIKQCRQWICDGRPPKSSNKAGATVSSSWNSTDMTLLAVTSSVMSMECDSDSWYVDNGATSHVTNNKEYFQTFELFSTPHTVTTANGDIIKAIGKGTIDIEAAVYGSWHKMRLGDVWYVPNIQKNLFSVLSAHDKNPESEFRSNSEVCNLIIGQDVKLVGARTRFGGLFKLAMRCIKHKYPTEVNVLNDENLLQLYHERFGHQNKRHVKTMIYKNLGVNVGVDTEICEGCVYGKAHRLPFGTRKRASKPGELIHTDVCGPFMRSMSGNRYFVLFKDDYTKFRYIYVIKEKSEVADKLKLFINETKTAGHVVKELLSDNGGEFDNHQVRNILQQEGIVQRLTMPYTPQQNGCSERENRTVVETARAIMHAHGNIPQGLWAEMINTAGYILNRTGPSNITGVSSYEAWYGKKPGIKHLRIIGSTCYAHIPSQQRKKMDKKATEGILIGYDHDEGYRIWCARTNKLIRSRDVIFHEKTLTQKKGIGVPVCIQDSTTQTEEELKNDVQLQDEDSVSFKDDSEEACGDMDENDETGGQQLRDRSKIKPPEKYKDYSMSIITNIEEPETYSEALKSEQQEDWTIAMDREINALNENQTWVLEDLPTGKRAIPCKWVYKVKTNSDGSVDKFKARLVVKGFSQKKGVDFDQTFSPVARMSTIRTLLSVAANENMTLTQIDVSSAFLYGEITETIFMRQPEGYNDGSNRVCRLKKSLYGLKQAPRCWNEKFSDHIIKMGFTRSEADPCLFVRQKGCNKLFLVLYVDDGLIASNNQNEVEQFINELRNEFKITSKPASYFLGLEINQVQDGSMYVSQMHYTKKILERFGMSSCRAVSTPIIKDGGIEESTLNTTFPYRQAVGALMFLMCGTRPDIAYAVGVVSRTLEKPTEHDVVKVKRIFRYLKGTADKGIIYRNNTKKGILECYSDADHGGDLQTGRSTSGVLCIYSGGPISWISQRQVSTAISTTEAEVVAASEAARESVWLKRVLQEFDVLKGTPVLQIDNEAATRLAQNPEFHRRTKHIRIRHFFVRELVLSGDIKVSKVDSEKQLADILTKPLFSTRIEQLCTSMGLVKLLNEGEC